MHQDFLTECRRLSVPGGDFTLHAAGFQNIGHSAGCPLASRDQSDRQDRVTLLAAITSSYPPNLIVYLPYLPTYLSI